MGKLKYQIGDKIDNKAGLSFLVKRITNVPSGTKGRTKTQYHTTCSKCGHNATTIAGGHEKRKSCPSCEGKPAAMKTDESGNCITICRMGQLEYIHRLITEEGMAQRDATEAFVDAVQAHAVEGDPFTEELTVEKVRSQFRRDSGKLKDKPKNMQSWVGPTQDSTADDEIVEKAKKIQGERSKKELKQKNNSVVEDKRVTDAFLAAFAKMEEAIQNESDAGWSLMKKKTALQYANILVDILTYGRSKFETGGEALSDQLTHQ